MYNDVKYNGHLHVEDDDTHSGACA